MPSRISNKPILGKSSWNCQCKDKKNLEGTQEKKEGGAYYIQEIKSNNRLMFDQK